MLLKKITTEYIDREDRLRITAQADGDATVVLWFSQRLLVRLVPHITRWLEKQSRVTGVDSALSTDAVRDFAAECAQQTAREGLVPQQRVSADTARSAWLVHTVDVSESPTEMRLTFKGDGDQRAVLVLAPTPLHQWLGIVHDQFRVAEWSRDVWPRWMGEGGGTGRPAGLVH